MVPPLSGYYSVTLVIIEETHNEAASRSDDHSYQSAQPSIEVEEKCLPKQDLP